MRAAGGGGGGGGTPPPPPPHGGGEGVTFDPIVDKQGMVHSKGPALTHLDLNMPTATCKVTQS